MKRVPRATKDNAPYQKNSLPLIQVTYKRHPLHGQVLDLVEFIKGFRGEDPTVIVRLRNGGTVRLPLTYTDYLPAHRVDADQPDELPPYLLGMDGLRLMVKIIERIKQKRGTALN